MSSHKDIPGTTQQLERQGERVSNWQKLQWPSEESIFSLIRRLVDDWLHALWSSDWFHESRHAGSTLNIAVHTDH